MRTAQRLFLVLTICVATAANANSQTQAQPTPLYSIESTGEFVKDRIFESTNGGFSIAIPQLPSKTIELGTYKAREKKIDAGKQFAWVFERTLYTALYTPPYDADGNPSALAYADMESGSRKGILKANAKLISEKPIKFGEYQGVEFRYTSVEGVHFIGRTFLTGDMGYQIVGGYADEKDEKKVLEVLDSFKLLKENPTKSFFSEAAGVDSQTRPGELRLNSHLGLIRDIFEKGEVEPRTKLFRMDIPFLKAKYLPPTTATPYQFQYQWNFDDGIVVLSINRPVGGTFSSLSLTARKEWLTSFLQKSSASAGAQKLSDRDISIKSIVGREIKVKRTDDIVIARTYIVGDMYVSVSAAIAGSSTEPDVMRLFDSLIFLK